jgi:hypothetical protein
MACGFSCMRLLLHAASPACGFSLLKQIDFTQELLEDLRAHTAMHFPCQVRAFRSTLFLRSKFFAANAKKPHPFF